jgi:cob(I)alamin adenosyltransferase
VGTKRKNHKGLVIVYTGDGKGKTTAALGMLLRAWGRGFKTCVIQFIKAEGGLWGEVKAAQRLNIEWHKVGDGFTWLSKDIEESQAKALFGWQLAQQKISSGDYDLIILDEFTYPLIYDWLDPLVVIKWIRDNKPVHTHLVITGREAPQALIDYADLVTEMHSLKHPFDQGNRGQPGIDF